MGEVVLFEEVTKRSVRQIKGDFIPNKCFHDSPKLLNPTRLVVKTKHWYSWTPDYRVSDYVLENVLKDIPTQPGLKTSVFLNDFALDFEKKYKGKVLGQILSFGGKVEGKCSTQVKCKLGKLNKMELNDLLKLKTDIARRKMSPDLGLKKNEKLVIVNERIVTDSSFYIEQSDEVDAEVNLTGNTHPGKIEVDGGVLRKGHTSMDFLEKTVIAYTVQELMELNNTDDDKLGADSGTLPEFIYAGSINCLDKVLEDFGEFELILQPLESLPKEDKSSLFEELHKVLIDRPTFQRFLEDRGEGWCQSVCTYLDQRSMKSPGDSRFVAESLIRAIDALPNWALNMLANCSSSELQALNKLVTQLKTNHSNFSPPETLPPKLQEGGEYNWATQLLCSANENLQDDGTLFLETGIQPGGLLLVLCIAVQGLTFLGS